MVEIDHSPPELCLLSNDRYSVLLTASGGGYSIVDGMDVTRWREDATRDCWGQYCYIRDLDDDSIWSAGRQPAGPHVAPPAADAESHLGSPRGHPGPGWRSGRASGVRLRSLTMRG